MMQQALAMLPLASALLLTLVVTVAWLASELVDRHGARRTYPEVRFARPTPVLQHPKAPAQVAGSAPNDAEPLKLAA